MSLSAPGKNPLSLAEESERVRERERVRESKWERVSKRESEWERASERESKWEREREQVRERDRQSKKVRKKSRNLTEKNIKMWREKSQLNVLPHWCPHDSTCTSVTFKVSLKLMAAHLYWDYNKNGQPIAVSYGKNTINADNSLMGNICSDKMRALQWCLMKCC